MYTTAISVEHLADNRNMRPMDVARLNNHEETVAVLKRDMIKHAAYARFN